MFVSKTISKAFIHHTIFSQFILNTVKFKSDWLKEKQGHFCVCWKSDPAKFLPLDHKSFRFPHYLRLQTHNFCRKANSEPEWTIFNRQRSSGKYWGQNRRRALIFHKICNISHSHHMKVRVGRVSNKNKIAINFFQFCDTETQQR